MRFLILSLSLFSFFACGSDPLPGNPPSDEKWSNYLRSTDQDDVVTAIAVLDDGTVAIAGYERGRNNENVTPAGDTRAFVTFHNRKGEQLAERIIDTSGSDVIDALVADPMSRDLFVVGRTTGALEGSENAGQYDLFAGVLDPLGERADHYSQFGTEYPQHPRRVIADERGGLLIAGFDDIYIPTNYVDRWSDPLLVRFEADRTAGTKLSYDWYRSRETSYGDSYHGIAYEAATQSIYVAGNVERGPGAFIEKRDRFDSVVWSTVLSDPSIDIASDVVAIDGGDLLVTGATYMHLSEKTYGDQDAFVARIDGQTGAIEWATHVGSSGAEYPLDLEVDAGGHIFVAGETTGAIVEGEFRGSYDVFVAELDASGTWIRSFQYGGEGDDRASAIALSAGRVLVGGYSEGTRNRDGFVIEAALK